MRLKLKGCSFFEPYLGLSIFVMLAGINLSTGLMDPSPNYVEIEETFFLDYQVDETRILAAEVWRCYRADCSWYKIHTSELWSEDRAAKCSDSICTKVEKYRPFDGDFQRLRIRFSDRVRVSNIFQVNFFEPADFIVTVREYDLLVSPNYLISPFVQLCFFIPLLGITIAIEIAVASYLSKRWQLPRIRGRIAIANLITVPIVWFILPSLPLGAVLVVVLSESFAVAFEALFIRYTRSGISGRFSLNLSLGMNGASFLIGLVIFGIISIL